MQGNNGFGSVSRFGISSAGIVIKVIATSLIDDTGIPLVNV